MGFFSNIKASIDSNSSISVNGITLLLSCLIGVLLGLTLCIAILIDVWTNGYVKTDLVDAGIFLLCSGGYIAGSGVPKTIVDSRLAKSLAFRKNKKFEGVSAEPLQNYYSEEEENMEEDNEIEKSRY